MALVTKITWDYRKVNWSTEKVCTLRKQIFCGEMYIQLNGTDKREFKGQSSQALTFSRENAIMFREMLNTSCPWNNPYNAGLRAKEQ